MCSRNYCEDPVPYIPYIGTYTFHDGTVPTYSICYSWCCVIPKAINYGTSQHLSASAYPQIFLKDVSS